MRSVSWDEDELFQRLFILLVTLRKLGVHKPVLSHSEMLMYATKRVVR